MQSDVPEHVRPIKYRVTALIGQLKLSKNIKFQTKICWRRNQNKAETSTVTHNNGFSTFNERLAMDFTMYYDTSRNCFLDKNTEFAVIICLGENVKSGGSTKFDIADPLNSNLAEANNGEVRKLQLLKCPDPQAYLEVTIGYEIVDQPDTPPTEMSIMNTSAQDLNLSRFDMPEEGKKSEVSKIGSTITQFEQLAVRIREKNTRGGVVTDPDSGRRLEMLEGECNRLRTSLETAEQKIMSSELSWRNERRDLERQNHDLEKMLDKKSKELSDRSKEILVLNEAVSKLKAANLRSDDSTEDGQHSQSNFEQLYRTLKQKHEQSLRELQQLRPKAASNSKTDLQHFELRNNHSFEVDFGKEFGMDVQDHVMQGEDSHKSERVLQLEKQKVQLQNKLALTSNKLGQIFNVAYEIGGAKLLDKLQSSIGLTENPSD